MIWGRFRKNLSWHVIVGDFTRCGRRWVEGMEMCSAVPGDERTCERCAVLTLQDEAEAKAIA